MSTPAINPANLPAIPTRARQIIYGLWAVALTAFWSLEAYHQDAVPEWVEGGLRVLLGPVGLFVGLLALVNATPTQGEQLKKAINAQADLDAHPDSNLQVNP